MAEFERERITKVETERIAKVETTVKIIEKAIERLESKLDLLLDNIEKRFLPRSEHAETIKHLETKFTQHEKDLKDLQERFDAEVTTLNSRIGKIPASAAALITFLTMLVMDLISRLYGG